MSHINGTAGPGRGPMDDVIPPITPEQARKAALQAADAVADLAELRRVLDMLGIAEVLR